MKCFCGKKLIVENRDLTFYTCYRHNNKLATNITYISVGSDIDSNIILDETSELSYGIIIESEKHSFI